MRNFVAFAVVVVVAAGAFGVYLYTHWDKAGAPTGAEVRDAAAAEEQKLLPAEATTPPKAPVSSAVSQTPAEVHAPAASPTPTTVKTPAANQQQPPPQVQQQPTPRIQLPDDLRGVRFGMSPQMLANRFPPNWRRETADTLTLVHYADRSRTLELRFEFKQGKLQIIEKRVMCANRGQVAATYDRFQKEIQARYASLPGSTSSRWSDGYISIRLTRHANYVSLTFRGIP